MRWGFKSDRCPGLQALENRYEPIITAESSRAEYHLGRGETIHSANQRSTQVRKSELGTADEARTGDSYSLRRSGPEARIERADLCDLGNAKAVVWAQQRPLLHPGMATEAVGNSG
jgi:hypothetical protein